MMDNSLLLQPSWAMRRAVVMAALAVLALFTGWDLLWLGLSHQMLYPLVATRMLFQWLPLSVLLVEALREVSIRQFRRWMWWTWVMVGIGNALISIMPVFYGLELLTANGQFLLMLFGFFLTHLRWHRKLTAGLIVTFVQLSMALYVAHPDWVSQAVYLGILVAIGTLSARQQDALHNATLSQNRRLKALSETDALTGIDNRYAFERTLDRLLDAPQPLVLALIDVDRFKRYNDLNGHLEGDRCLQQLADSLSEVSGGKLARYGGEEFVAWLAGGHDPDAFARRLVEQVRAMGLAHPDGDLVSVSVGVTLSLPSDNRRALLLRADQALYQAKAAGRDQWVVA
ncbi:sensor domain-containing diguanylate cyclase [Gallaecimonas xiamenensis]|uniref:diguanylate cyclase n=1 Tax=Gallaecimonas xiamenensis 3-C-1 TaxID=745411 RepID=K2INH4_9GAMM|nr:GGDEF domain-containing protein [Gallaecimonas xiamenensis]EKE71661.1 diguanylate cyclase [Gallaecimonas xiamenensis 3-C-1]